MTSCHQDISQSWSKSSPPAELLLKQVDSAAIPLQNFRGSASIETFVSGIKSRASLRIRYLNPRQYRIDIDGPLFQVLAIILVNNKKVKIYLPRENTVFVGTLKTDSEQIPGLPLSLEDIHNTIIGGIKSENYLDLPILDYRYSNNIATLKLQDGNITRTLLINTKNMTLLSETSISKTNEKSIIRTFDRYRKRNGIWRPSTVKITRKEMITEIIKMKYRTQSVNRGLRVVDLDLALPKTVLKRPLNEAILVYKQI